MLLTLEEAGLFFKLHRSRLKTSDNTLTPRSRGEHGSNMNGGASISCPITVEFPVEGSMASAIPS